MLKRYLVILFAFTAISSAKADTDDPEAGDQDTIDDPWISIGNLPDDSLNRIPPEKLAPTDLFKDKVPPSKFDPINALSGIGGQQWLFPRTPAQKVTAEYVKPASGVGILVTGEPHGKNFKETWACTAFCVADNVIATNAHCLAKAKGQGLPSLDSINFLLRHYSFDDSQSRLMFGRREISRLKSVDERNPHLAIYSGYDFKDNTPAAAAVDWAFAKLHRPICQGLSLSLHPMKEDKLVAAGNNQKIFMIAYDKKNTIEPNIAQHCKIFSRSNSHKLPRHLRRDLRRNEAIVIHNCAGLRGSSGSPIFANMDGGPQVVAINQGFIKTVRRIPVKRVRRGNGYKTIYKTNRKTFKSAVHISAFIEGFKRFKEEKLLNSLDEFKEVQSDLKDLRLYHGKIDGLLGPGTKHALIRYEKRAGLVPIGLPTQRLLSLLRKEFKADETSSAGAE